MRPATAPPSCPTPPPTPLTLVALLAAALLGATLAGCAPPAPDRPTPASPARHDAPAQQDSPAQHDAPPAGAGPVTAQQAADIVTERYGGQVVAIDSDEGEHDEPTWRVELRSSDRGDVDGQVDQRTGTLLHLDKD